jgi:glyoxylase-like metal-dependent hydrolase (beta-lactamase superfamily II)
MSPVPHHARLRPSSRLITLGGSGRLSRRALLTNLGSAGIGLTILGACSGSSDDVGSANSVAGDTESSSTEPASASAAPSDPATTVAATSEPDAVGSGGLRLQLQHVSLGFVSAYVLLRGAEAAVVDTGQSGSAAAILEGLGAVGATWADVAHVVLTHNHGDHAGGLAGVLEAAPGAIVYAGEADLTGIQSSAPLRAIGDGDEVLGMGVFNTPGHTAGSISLFDTETGILVAGDAINGDNGSLTGANPNFSQDLDAATASIAKLAAMQPQVAAFGHGGEPIDNDVTAQLEALAAS